MIAATQYLMLYCIIKPFITYEYAPLFKPYNISLSLQFSDFDFFLLVLSTMLITAAGYVINDYFDRKTDLVNRPTSVIIGKKISSRTAMSLHWIFNGIGVALGIYISYKIDMLLMGMIYVFITGLLWFYSTTFNKQLLIGNIVVALLTALVPLFVAIYEIIPLNKVFAIHMRAINLYFNKIIFWSLGYAFFAFLLSLIREIVKDMEDLEGDNAYGRNSVPINIGMKASKYVVSLLIAGTIFLIYYASYTYIADIINNSSIVIIYFTVAISLPLAFGAYKVLVSDDSRGYHIASSSIKIAMVGGIAFSILLYFIISGAL